MRHRALYIQIEPDETYQDSVLRRLKQFGISQREVCIEMGTDPSQFSRWVARPSEHTGRPVDIGSGTVLQIEEAILAILARRRRPAAEPNRKGKARG